MGKIEDLKENFFKQNTITSNAAAITIGGIATKALATSTSLPITLICGSLATATSTYVKAWAYKNYMQPQVATALEVLTFATTLLATYVFMGTLLSSWFIFPINPINLSVLMACNYLGQQIVFHLAKPEDQQTYQDPSSPITQSSSNATSQATIEDNNPPIISPPNITTASSHPTSINSLQQPPLSLNATPSHPTIEDNNPSMTITTPLIEEQISSVPKKNPLQNIACWDNLSPQKKAIYEEYLKNFHLWQALSPTNQWEKREKYGLDLLPIRLPKNKEECDETFAHPKIVAHYAKNFDPKISNNQWVSHFYHQYPEIWKEGSLSYQIDFKKRIKTLPPYSYSLDLNEIKNFNKEQATLLRQEFDSDILISKGMNYFKTWVNWKHWIYPKALAYQHPELFKLDTNQRQQIFAAYLSLFERHHLALPSKIPQLFKKLIILPSKNKIKTLNQDELQGYGAYFKNNLSEWANLPLDVKFAFYNQDMKLNNKKLLSFPKPSSKTTLKGLKELAQKKPEAIKFFFQNTSDLFGLKKWILIDTETQQLLKMSFTHSNLPHALPCHPTSAPQVNNLSDNFIKNYHETFNPILFNKINPLMTYQASLAPKNYLQKQEEIKILEAFAKQFQKHQLSLEQTLQVNPNSLSYDWEDLKQSPKKALWLQIVLTQKKNLWDKLSFQEQVKAKNIFSYFIPHPYKNPQITDGSALSDQELIVLHEQYKRENPNNNLNSNWWKLTSYEQNILNQRFHQMHVDPKCFPTCSDILNGKNFSITQGQFLLDIILKKKHIVFFNPSDAEKTDALCFYPDMIKSQVPFKDFRHPWWKFTQQEQEKFNKTFKTLHLKSFPTYYDIIKVIDNSPSPNLYRPNFYNQCFFRNRLSANNFKIWNSFNYKNQTALLNSPLSLPGFNITIWNKIMPSIKTATKKLVKETCKILIPNGLGILSSNYAQSWAYQNGMPPLVATALEISTFVVTAFAGDYCLHFSEF